MAFPMWKHACNDFQPNMAYKGRYCRVCGWRYNLHGEALEEEMATQRAATPEELEAALKVLGMETGVAYMPVPRCKTCRWWKRFESCFQPRQIAAGLSFVAEIPDIGDCQLFECRNSEQLEPSCKLRVTRTQSGEATVSTDADFGCVQWEARDDGAD